MVTLPALPRRDAKTSADWVADTDYFFKPRRRSRSLRRARRLLDTTLRNSPVSICMLAASFRSRAASLSASIRSGPQGSARAFANASSAIDEKAIQLSHHDRLQLERRGVWARGPASRTGVSSTGRRLGLGGEVEKGWSLISMVNRHCRSTRCPAIFFDNQRTHPT